MSEQDRIIEHSYDGIQEYDNPMPAWWVTIFWATIIFSAIYAINRFGIGAGKGRIAEYEAEMAAARKAHPVEAPSSTPEQLLTLAASSERVHEGEELFAKNCVACHGADGGGIIGPNLTDDAWIHGGRIEQIHATINGGVLAKGMPAWGQMLKPRDIDELTAYVWSLHGTRPAKPKAPEGEVVPR
ncbi:MAG: cbb3-type cytochrome c oxidase N-terminal domain-containing protein [Gemmatimonadota bacterium]